MAALRTGEGPPFTSSLRLWDVIPHPNMDHAVLGTRPAGRCRTANPRPQVPLQNAVGDLVLQPPILRAGGYGVREAEHALLDGASRRSAAHRSDAASRAARTAGVRRQVVA